VNFQSALHVAGTLSLRNGFVIGAGSKTIDQHRLLRGNGSVVGDMTINGPFAPASASARSCSATPEAGRQLSAEFSDPGSDQLIVVARCLDGGALDLTQLGPRDQQCVCDC